ncbi:hypothetical protein SRHO_G00158780 [Serrasalmus rhombeus]
MTEQHRCRGTVENILLFQFQQDRCFYNTDALTHLAQELWPATLSSQQAPTVLWEVPALLTHPAFKLWHEADIDASVCVYACGVFLYCCLSDSGEKGLSLRVVSTSTKGAGGGSGSQQPTNECQSAGFGAFPADTSSDKRRAAVNTHYALSPKADMVPCSCRSFKAVWMGVLRLESHVFAIASDCTF